MITREQAYDALASLNVAPVFLESYRSEQLPWNLDLYFRPPEEFFLAPETQHPYTLGKLIPLLDDGNFDLVTFLDPASKILIQQSVEEPGETREQFQHWQQFLAHLLIQIGETVDEEAELRAIGELLRFKHTEKVLEFRDRQLDDYEQQRAEFISSIEA